MGFVRCAALMIVTAVLTGCVSSGAMMPGVAYEEGYQKGVKDNLGKMAEGLNGNGFPYLRGSNWAEPLIQDVRIPAHVQGGVFYPEHNELVIITPGEWIKSGGFPLRSPEYSSAERVEVLAADITALPPLIHNERQIR